VRGVGFVLVGVSLGIGAADWFAVARGNRHAEYILKPATLAILFLAATLLKPNGVPCPEQNACVLVSGTPTAPSTTTWVFVLVALALSLAGDVFLMLPQDLFVAGLGAFLLAHIAYVVAFNVRSAPPFTITLVAAVAVGAVAYVLFDRMRRGMIEKGQREFVLPVAVYVLAIGAMVVSAIATAGRPEWSAANSALAIAGALSFMASDSMIGWNRFVQPIPRGNVWVMATYHVGQVLLVLGLLG
jgi:uncharacterized membrane protein YhhN